MLRDIQTEGHVEPKASKEEIRETIHVHVYGVDINIQRDACVCVLRRVCNLHTMRETLRGPVAARLPKHCIPLSKGKLRIFSVFDWQISCFCFIIFGKLLKNVFIAYCKDRNLSFEYKL